MKLTNEQIKKISQHYNEDWDCGGSVFSEEWRDGYQSGIVDTLLSLGYSKGEAKEALKVANQ